MDVSYLTLGDAVELVRDLGVGPIRDLGLLDSALGRPRSSAFGQDVYPTLGLKAAALLHSLTNNHALVDGNKRLALLATAVFLDLNGHQMTCTDDEAFELIWEVASPQVELADIASRLKPGRSGRSRKSTVAPR